MISMRTIALVFVMVWSGSAMATNLSLLSGLYQKSEPQEGPASSQLSLGARVGFGSDTTSQWYGQAKLGSLSYSGDNAPGGSKTLSLGGGQFYFLKNFGNGVRSYLSWLVAFLNEEANPTALTTVKSNGLFYAGNAGFRFELSRSLFFDVNAELFNSALTAKETNTTTAAGVATSTETKRTEIYADTLGGIEDLSFSLGYEF